VKLTIDIHNETC